MADGLSVRKTAARLGLSVQKTFRWRHKFLAFLNQQKPSALSGIVEADETFFLVSYKGQRKALPRSPKKRGGKGLGRLWQREDRCGGGGAAGHAGGL